MQAHLRCVPWSNQSDPGLATTGWGVVTGTKSHPELVEYGVIKTPAGLAHEQRLTLIHKSLFDLIKKYKPTKVAVEQLFFYKNVKTASKVGEARGVLLLAIAQSRLPLVEMTPLQVKQALTSYGRADKQQVQKMVKLVLRLKQIPKPDDAADALAIALTCLQTADKLK